MKSILQTLLIMTLFVGFVNVFADGDEYLGATLPQFSGTVDFAVMNLGALSAQGRASSIVKLPAQAEIVAALLYGSGYSDLSRDELGDITLTFTNKTDNTTLSAAASLIGYAEADGHNYFSYRGDVTSVVTAGTKTYRLSGFALPNLPQNKGAFFGVGLLIIYSDPSYPQSIISIADGLDYLNGQAGIPTSETVAFEFGALGFNQTAAVKLFTAQATATTGASMGTSTPNANSGANAIWYQTGQDKAPLDDLMDVAGAVDYENSSSSDPSVDCDPLTLAAKSLNSVEFSAPVNDQDSWLALELESQTDKAGVTPYQGIWLMAASRISIKDVGCGTIGDVVFFDRDGDGIKAERQEAGIPGVTVRLYADNGDGVFQVETDLLLKEMITNELGYYEFKYLEEGDYFVEIAHEKLDPQAIRFTGMTNPSSIIHLDSCTPQLEIDYGLTLVQKPSRGGNGNTGSGFNFGGFGFLGGFGQTIPAELSDFQILAASDHVQVAYLAVNAEESKFEVYRSHQRILEYQLIDVPIEKAVDGERLVFTDNAVESGKQYYYQIAEIDQWGDRMMHGPLAVSVTSTPDGYRLHDAYPNPFNPSTRIQYTLSENSPTSLQIFNMMGQKVRTLVNSTQTPGVYAVDWDGTSDEGKSVPAGVYIYRLKAGNFESSKQVIFLK